MFGFPFLSQVASSEKPKKQKNESHSDEKEDKVSKIGKEEGDLADEYNDVEGDGGGTKFDNNLDFENEVYDYDDDYGYDEY